MAWRAARAAAAWLIRIVINRPYIHFFYLPYSFLAGEPSKLNPRATPALLNARARPRPLQLQRHSAGRGGTRGAAAALLIGWRHVRRDPTLLPAHL